MLQSDINVWEIKHQNKKYRIMYSPDRGYTQPKWWVLRIDDVKTSTRFYSFAAGAFLALSSGAIIWE